VVGVGYFAQGLFRRGALRTTELSLFSLGFDNKLYAISNLSCVLGGVAPGVATDMPLRHCTKVTSDI